MNALERETLIVERLEKRKRILESYELLKKFKLQQQKTQQH
jgi:hypothetical protein